MREIGSAGIESVSATAGDASSPAANTKPLEKDFVMRETHTSNGI
jgi:hypothetical protein